MYIISSILFSLSANLDNLSIGIAYGVKKVKISVRGNLLIAAISCLGTFLSMVLGDLISHFLPATAAGIIGSSILILIGLYFVISFVRESIRHQESGASPSPAPERGNIRVRELAAIGFALAINNMGMGIGASIAGLNPYLASVCTFVFSFLFILIGQHLGKTYLSGVCGKYAVFISGLIVLGLGVFELLC